MKNRRLILIPLILALGIIAAGYVHIPVTHAATGTVCLEDPGLPLPPTSTTACPTPSTFSGPAAPGTLLRVAVNLDMSDTFNSFDIILKADHTVLLPVDADFCGGAAGSTCTGGLIPFAGGAPFPTVKCLGTVAVMGTCNQTPMVTTPDTLEFGVGSSGTFPTAPVSGLLFIATYRVVGTASSPITIGFQTGCTSSSGTSIPPNTCVTIGNGTLTPTSETGATATFSTAATAVYHTASASPASFTVTPGAAASISTVTFTSVNGFDCGAASPCVNLFATAPSGLTSSLSAPSVVVVPGTSGTATVTMSTSLTTAPGLYAVHVLGITSTTTTPLTGTTFLGAIADIIIRVQDFRLSASPASLTISQGSQGTSKITVTSDQNFAATVNLLPPSILPTTGAPTVGVAPTSVTLTANSSQIVTLTVTTSSTTALSSFIARVTGSGGGVSRFVTVSVKVVRPTATVLLCSPSSVPLNSPSTCQATVTDTSSTPTTPGGQVGFATDSTGTFSGGGICMLTAGTTAGTASCSVTYTPTQTGTGTHNLNATYQGDTTHGQSVSKAAITIGVPFDYSLSNNGPVSIQQGSSGTVTITATLKAGTAQSVTLSCVTPLPSGITCTSFNPSSVTPSSTGASSVLTIAVASSVAPGPYSVQVTGIPLGATTTPTTLSITVTSVPFDYSLSNNGPVSIQQGSSGTVTIAATLKSGTATSVTLSCVTPLPSGISCTSFNPSSVTPSSTGATSVLTIAIASSVATGPHTIQVTGSPLGATTTPTTLSITVTVIPFDYSLSNNGPVSIQQGSSGTVTITATLKAGAAQSVSLSCVTPLPSGITCTSFAPPSVAPSSTGAPSVLSIAVGASVAPGSYSVQVTGAPIGATTTPTSVSLTVTPVPFDYSLSNNGPVSIQQGTSSTVTITATLKAGTVQSVALSCVTPLPSGISCTSFNPPSVTPSLTGASSVLTISVASSVAAGPQSIQVTGTPLGATTAPTTVSITVTFVPFDYTFSNNGPASIQQGSSGTVTITAALKSGSAQSVTLSCVTPLPSGITCTSFNPASVTPSSTGASSTLTIAVASSVVPGSYSVQVTGSPLGATTTPTTVSITVTPVPFDYSLSNNGPVSIQQGSSATVTITATLKSGAAQSVTLSCVTPLPSGITCTSFNPPSVTPTSTGATSVLTISVGSSVATGSHTIQVTGTPLGATTTPTTVSITVTSVPFDYSLSNNGPVSIQLGSSGTVTITATLKSGTAQSVTLSCVTPLPSGITCTSFNPPTVTPSSTGATGVLTIAVASSVAPGSYSVQVTGAPLGATTTPTTVGVTVTAVPFDYSLSNNGPVSIQQGSSGTVTITATLKAGSAQSVTLSCVTPLPSGVTCTSFNPPSVTPSSTGASSVLTIAVASSVATGSHSIQVTGSPLGATTAPTTVSITVTSVPFDYSLSNNGPVSIQQGSSSTVTITATLKSGSGQSVTLSCVTPIPSGITCTSFSPPSVTPSSTGATSVLTIAVASSVAPGSYSVQVTGAPLGATTTPTTVSITVTAVPFDYSLSNNGPVSIQQGTSGTVMITATLKAGSALSVTLSCVTPLPTGITCTSFSPTSVAPTGSSTLTIAISSSISPGPYSVQVTGSPAGATASGATTTITVTVTTASFDFSLSTPSPNSLTVAQGGTSGSSSITATLTSGSSNSVTFQAFGQPSGVTPTFTNNPCSPTCMVTVSFTASSSATTGTFTITITASGGGASHSTMLSLTVTSVTPTAHPTQTNVNCSPGSVPVGTATTCTARVIDTSSSPTNPTGTVSFTTDNTGTFNPSAACTLSASNGPSMSTCSVSYTGTVVAHHLITGSYSGDSSHALSSGSFNINVRSVPPGKTTLTFAGFDLDDFENGLGQFQVLVNDHLVADIPAGVNKLTGSGDYGPYHDVWVSFGPFDVTSFVVQGQNTVVIRDPQTIRHFGRVKDLVIAQSDTVLLNAPRSRGIHPGFTVTYTFSNPPLVSTALSTSSTALTVGEQVTFTATYAGGTGPFKCIFLFGDDSSAVVSGVDGTCTASHTYEDSGRFTARVIIMGSSTSDVARNTLPVTVADQ